MKDLSKSRSDYILLDLSGFDEFLTHLNHFMETNTNKCTEFLFEKRTMTHNKKVFFSLSKFNKFFVNENIIRFFF